MARPYAHPLLDKPNNGSCPYQVVKTDVVTWVTAEVAASLPLVSIHRYHDAAVDTSAAKQGWGDIIYTCLNVWRSK